MKAKKISYLAIILFIFAAIQIGEILVFTTMEHQILYDKKTFTEGSEISYTVNFTPGYYSIFLLRDAYNGKFKVSLYDPENKELLSTVGEVLKSAGRHGSFFSDFFEVIFRISTSGNYTVKIKLLDAWPDNTCEIEIEIANRSPLPNVLFLGYDKFSLIFSAAVFAFFGILYWTPGYYGTEKSLRELSDRVGDINEIKYGSIILRDSNDSLYLYGMAIPIALFAISILVALSSENLFIDLFILLRSKAITHILDLTAPIVILPRLLSDRDFVAITDTGTHYAIGIKKKVYYVKKSEDVKLVVYQISDSIYLELRAKDKKIIILIEKAKNSKIPLLIEHGIAIKEEGEPPEFKEKFLPGKMKQK